MKVKKIEKAKIYHPKTIIPEFAANIITNNVTKPNGNVVNSHEQNSEFARKWVDDNHL